MDWELAEDTTESYIWTLAVFNGYIYAGTGLNGLIYRSSNGMDWELAEDTTETRINTLAVFNGYIYAGTGYNGLIYRSSNGMDWELVKDTTEDDIYTLAVFNEYIYAGTSPNGLIYRNIPQIEIFYPQSNITTLIQYASTDNPSYHEYKGNTIFEKNLTALTIKNQYESVDIISNPTRILNYTHVLLYIIICVGIISMLIYVGVRVVKRL
jgi:hypothetical protein